MIGLLLELGADMAWADERGNTCTYLSQSEDIDSMRAFIDAGLYFNLRSRLGRGVLHEAIRNSKGAIVELLLREGGEKIIHSRDSTGKTPLHLAVHAPKVDAEIVKLLC